MKKTGAQETVAFIHGAGGSARTWYFQGEHFKDLLDVVLVDLPGHGDSPGEGCDTIEGYRDFVVRGLRTRGPVPVVLVGHSMGGAIAMSIALTHPEMVRALVLIGTGGRLKVLPEILDGILEDKEGTSRRILDFAFSPSASPLLKEMAYQEYLKNRADVVFKDFTACDHFDVIESLGRITAPTLILCGTLDRLTPVKYSEFLKERITQATLQFVEGAGHMVMVENAGEVNSIIERFLAGRS